MSRCIDVYNKMPEKVQRSIDIYKTIYRTAKEHGQYDIAKETTNKASGYCKALMDAGLITERERQQLFILTTV